MPIMQWREVLAKIAFFSQRSTTALVNTLAESHLAHPQCVNAWWRMDNNLHKHCRVYIARRLYDGLLGMLPCQCSLLPPHLVYNLYILDGFCVCVIPLRTRPPTWQQVWGARPRSRASGCRWPLVGWMGGVVILLVLERMRHREKAQSSQAYAQCSCDRDWGLPV